MGRFSASAVAGGLLCRPPCTVMLVGVSCARQLEEELMEWKTKCEVETRRRDLLSEAHVSIAEMKVRVSVWQRA